MTRREGDLNFRPERIHAVARDGIDHRDERLSAGETGVRLVYDVLLMVLRQERPLGSGELKEIDRE